MDIDTSINNLIRTDVFPIIDFKYKGIQFSSKFKKQSATIKDRLFKEESIDSKSIHEFEKKDGIIIMKNLILPKNLSLRNFTYIIAFALNVNISSIILKSNNIPYFKNLQINDYLDNFSIGNSKISILITNKEEIENLGYERIFWNQYINSIYYFSSLNDWKLKVFPTIENISIICLMKNVKISITKLFNSNSVSTEILKILIHSSKLDSFNGNYRQMQYVKFPIYLENGFVNTVSNYETTTFYVNLWDTDIIKLSRIEVSENGVIVFRFNVTDTSENIETITQHLKQFIDAGMIKKSLEKIQFDECVLSETIPKFSRIEIGDIVSSVVIQGMNGENFDEISKLFNQGIPWLKYKTNTSISVGFFTENSFTSSINYYQSLNSHEYITKQIVQKFILETLHILINHDNTIITFYGIDSIEEMSWLCSLICGIFEKPKINQFNYKADKSPETIKNKYQNIPSKKLLKVLFDADNIIFGPRKISDTYRPYSSLAQRDVQRVVIVSKEEFKILSKSNPESCANIQSQEKASERLLLFCPFDDYKYINFRYLTNQICFPKCTNNLTNRNQFKFCSNQLGMMSYGNFETKYENKTLIMYNSLISFNRKCKPPIELTNILVNYYLVKPKLKLSISQYCMNMFKKYPFIIRRDFKNGCYEILSDYDKSGDYVLVLQSESDGNYFVILSNDSNEPFILREHEEFKQTVDAIVDASKIRDQFISFINKIFKFSFKDEPIHSVFKELCMKHGVILVADDRVIKGVIKNNVFYSTPEILINHITNIYKIADFKIIILSILKGLINLPKLEDLPKDQISKLLIDFKLDSVCGVVFMDSILFISPFSDWEELNYPFEYFDYQSLLIFNSNKEKIVSIYKSTNSNIKTIFDIWTFIYVSTRKTFDIEDLRRFLENHLIIKEGRKLKFLSNTFFISWRKSEVTKDDLNGYLDEIKNKSNFLYSFSNLINDDMIFKYDYTKESIQSKIITSSM